MKIFIDDGLSLNKKKTGIGYFSQDIIDIYKYLGHDVFTWSFSNYFCQLPAFIQRFIYLIWFNKLAFTKKYDLIIYTNFVVPPFKHKAKVIATIHDLSVIFFPQTFSLIYRYYFRWGLSNALKNSNYIFTVSDSVKQEINNYFKNKKIILTIYNVIRSTFTFPETSIKKIKQLLFVGVIEKRKNIILLCKAFIKICKLYPEFKLIIIGKPGYGFKEISKYFSNIPNIEYLNYVPKERLIEEYTKSRAFIFPSLYEGFGLPIIEAMKYNLPIIASDIPTNRELNNRHNADFIFFNPNDEDSLFNVLVCFINQSICSKSVDLGFYSMEHLAHLHKTILEKYILPNITVV